MRSDGEKLIKYLLPLFAAAFIFMIGGCSDELASVLDEDQTDMASRRILEDVSTVDKNPNINIAAPEVYTRPTKVLNTTEGLKVFYFAKNKSPKDLDGLLKAQMGVKVMSASTGTNQLIISCADDKEVEEVLAFLAKVDVPAIQIKIDCIVVENYADFTMDRETQVKVGELFGDDDLVVTGPKNGWGFFPGASLREAKRGTYGMSIGYSSEEVSVLIDMLSSRGYLKVMMNPVVTTTANKPATIVSKDRVPIVKIVTGRDILPYNITEYTWVEDSLTVTPTVYSDGSIGLATSIKFGSKNTPEGVVQNRIITERSVDMKETRVPVGNSLVIGGFKKSEKFSVIRGFPFLKDLPLIGFIFSSKDFEERAKEITFILTPSIASEGIDFNEMVDKVQELHKTHKSEESITDRLTGIVTDPFSQGSYTEKVEQMAAQETIDRMKAEVQAAQTEREAQQARERLAEFEAKLKAEAEAKQKAQQAAKEYAAKLKALEEAKTKLEAAQKAELDKSSSQLEAAKAQYEKLSKEAEQTKNALEAQQKQVEQSQSQLKQTTEEINKLLEEKKAIEAEKQKLIKEKAEAEKAAQEARAKREAQERAEREAAEAAAAAAKAAAEAEEAARAAEQAQQEAQKAQEASQKEDQSQPAEPVAEPAEESSPKEAAPPQEPQAQETESKEPAVSEQKPVEEQKPAA